jgi:hypothetical protein
MRQMFRQLLAARGRPLTATERAEFEDQLAAHDRRLKRMRDAELGAKSSSGGSAPPAAGGSPASTLSDEELLKQLGVGN